MEDKLRLNTNLYGFEGIIGRRDYLLNLVIIGSISLFFTIPFYIWFFANITTLYEGLVYSIFYKVPLLLKIWFLFGAVTTFILTISNVFRRLNDINGCIDNNLNTLFSVIFLVFSFGVLLPPYINFLLNIIAIITGLFLLFKKGKITGKFPYDYTKAFNWGAFLGTWIWGLYNKSYKTLWQIPLSFTPLCFYYQIYCGLKGNEWAYKNKNYNDITEFNKSQETQTAVFAVIGLLLIPVIYLALVGIIIGTMIFTNMNDEKNNPEQLNQTTGKFEKIINGISAIYFDSHTITPDENKFFVSIDDWQTASFSDKKEMLDFAASLAANERRKEYEKQHPNEYKSFTKTSELNRTKIYCTETNELLGEFHVDEKVMQDGSFKDAFKAGLSAYRFYNP